MTGLSVPGRLRRIGEIADVLRETGNGSELRRIRRRAAATTIRRVRLVERFDRFQQRHAWLAFPVAVYRKYADDRGGYLAALVTYYAFFSLFPLLLVAATVFGFVLQDHPGLEREIANSLLGRLPIVGHGLRVHALTGSGVALAVGLASSLWGGTGVFMAASDAADAIWGIPRRRRGGFLRARGRALLLLLVLGGGAIGTTALSLLGGGSIAGSLAGDFAIFWVGSRLLTAQDVRWRQLAGGAAAAAVAWQLLQLGGGVYVRHVLRIASNTYGTFAVVIGLLSFIYLAALVAVVVAEGNVVAAKRLWPRSLTADDAALPQRVSGLPDSAVAPARGPSSPSTERSRSMDSIVERAGRLAGTELKRMRWTLGINGALSIAFGVVVLVWPGISLYALTVLFGAYAAANGIVGLAAAISGRVMQERGWLAFASLLNLAVGVMVLIWSGNGISELALLYVIGAYAVAFGVIAIGGAFWLPLDGGDRALIALYGLVSILFGIVMFARPGAGALVVLALIAAFALVSGISQLVVAIGGKRLLESRAKKLSAEPKPQTS